MERTRWQIHLSHRSEPESAPVVMVIDIYIYIHKRVKNMDDNGVGCAENRMDTKVYQRCTLSSHTFTSSYEVRLMQVDAVKSQSKLDGLKV